MSNTETKKLNLKHKLKGHKDRVWQLSWSPDGEILASCSSDKLVKLWKLNETSNEYECIDTIESKHTKTIRCLEWSPNGKYLALGSFDSFITIWKKTSSSMEFVTKLEGHENEVKSVSWSKIGETMLASCSRDRSIWIWEPISNEGDFECLSVLNGHTQDVKMVKWHPNREILMSSSYDDSIRTWTEDIDDWYCCSTLNEHKSTVWSFDFNKSGDYLVSVGDDQNLFISKLFESKDVDEPFEWKKIKEIKNEHKRTIYSVNWSKDNKYIATGSGDDFIRIFKWNGEENDIKNIFEIKGHISDINC
eukprot:gene4252-7589_t